MYRQHGLSVTWVGLKRSPLSQFHEAMADTYKTLPRDISHGANPDRLVWLEQCSLLSSHPAATLESLRECVQEAGFRSLRF